MLTRQWDAASRTTANSLPASGLPLISLRAMSKQSPFWWHGFFIRVRAEDGTYRERQEVVLLTGSHTLQIPWLETGHGRTLQQLPFAYIVAAKMWAPVTQTFLIPPNLKEYYSLGAWNGACMDC